MPDSQRIKIAVVFGGRSGEHDVSCHSAESVLANLDRHRYDVVPVKITRDGVWLIGGGTTEDPLAGSSIGTEDPLAGSSVDVADPLAGLSDGAGDPLAGSGVGAAGPLAGSSVGTADPLAGLSDGTAAGPGVGTAVTDGSGDAWRSMAGAVDLFRSMDVVFPVLHGAYGEDGTIQSVLEIAGVPYVGNGVIASAVGMDKEFTKKILAADGLPVARAVVLHAEAGRDVRVPMDEVRGLGLPVFVKPARSGSSIGVSKVDDLAVLDAAVAAALAVDSKVLIEEAVIGREVDFAVLEHPDGRLEVGPPLEIHVGGDQVFFDYTAKYHDAATFLEIPAKIDPELIRQLAGYSTRVFESLGCSGLLRIDFFLRDGIDPVINEVNTFPGFTDHSQYPRIWQVAGLSFPSLLDTLISTALARPALRAGVASGAVGR